jgi:NAD+ kinase
MKINLVLHPNRAAAVDTAGKLVAAAAERGITVVAAPDDAARLGGVEERDSGGLVDGDFVVAIGGDGTVLEAARVAMTAGIPLLGINAGNLGFLAEVEPARIDAALDALIESRYLVAERMTLSVEMPGGLTVEGLNDVVVEKAVSRQVVGVAVFVGEEPLVEYRADAVIVATPTGSTAYTFSAGGPLVDPDIEALILTPVAPHSVFGRAIVFSPDVVLDVHVTSDRRGRVNIDGRTYTELDPGQSIRISRGAAPARFIRLEPRNFAHTVKKKFQLPDA